MPVPNHIRRTREAFGIASKELAGILNVSPATVSRWESGEREVSDEDKTRIAAHFKLPVSAIFEYEWSPLADGIHRLLDVVQSLSLRVERLESQRQVERS